jgi:Family of unknown function (DUF5335)
MREIRTENREIPRGEWERFFEGFSRRHQGWLATVEVLREKLGAQTEARELPLQGIFSEHAGGRFTILLGGQPEEHLAHAVENPRRLWVEVTEGGAEAAIEVESEDGTKTILEFRSVMAPEMVDGVYRGGSGES